MSEQPTDFFISYNKADTEWATWIAWQLEQSGFTTVLQEWDFRPGNNFVLAMQEAARRAERTIAVLSNNYLASSFTQPEWAAMFAQDPTGVGRRLIPVRVERCDADGLLGPIIYIDLVDLSPDQALAALMRGLALGRAKPATPPSFPGAQAKGNGADAEFHRALTWSQLSHPASVVWKTSLQPRWGRESGPSSIELQMVPDGKAERLTVSRLQQLPNELADVGRQGELFSATQALEAQSDDEVALAISAQTRSRDTTGLMVTRAGQRGCWFTLPHDMLGSVLDLVAVEGHLKNCLRTLMAVDTPMPQRFAFAMAIRSTSMLMQGSASIVGHRNSASLAWSSGGDIEMPPEDSVAAVDIVDHADEIATELIARLSARLGSAR